MERTTLTCQNRSAWRARVEELRDAYGHDVERVVVARRMQRPQAAAWRTGPEREPARTHRTTEHWGTTAISAWKAERSAVRPVHDEDSVLYTGAQALTSNSAAVSTDQRVKKAIKLAGLA